MGGFVIEKYIIAIERKGYLEPEIEFFNDIVSAKKHIIERAEKIRKSFVRATIYSSDSYVFNDKKQLIKE